jgi:CrcB protein
MTCARDTVERQPIVIEAPPGARPRHDPVELAAIFAGGFVGAIARTALVRGFPIASGQWPWVTMSVNLLGAALLGGFIAWLGSHPEPSDHRRAFLATGFCGALTTFSTLMIELLGMIEASRWGLLAGYALASVLGGLAAVWLGGALARRVLR